MQAQERERLVRRYNRPELSPAARVAKCAAGLLITALIAVIGQPSSQSESEKLAQNARVTQASLQGDQKAKQREREVSESHNTRVAVEHLLQVEETVYRKIP
jgi:hypothetical protein